MEGSGRGLILRHNPDIRFDGLSKTTKNLNQDSRYSVPDLNPRPPRHEAGC
jgi:hypothetical protein